MLLLAIPYVVVMVPCWVVVKSVFYLTFSVSDIFSDNPFVIVQDTKRNMQKLVFIILWGNAYHFYELSGVG